MGDRSSRSSRLFPRLSPPAAVCQITGSLSKTPTSVPPLPSVRPVNLKANHMICSIFLSILSQRRQHTQTQRGREVKFRGSNQLRWGLACPVTGFGACAYSRSRFFNFDSQRTGSWSGNPVPTVCWSRTKNCTLMLTSGLNVNQSNVWGVLWRDSDRHLTASQKQVF